MSDFKGFSLVEMLFTLCVAMTLISIAAPSLSEVLRRAAIQSSSEKLVASISLARNLAIQRRQAITITSPEGGWAEGWNIYIDSNGSGAQESDEPSIRVQGPLDKGVKVLTNRPVSSYIRYLPDGRTYLHSGGFQAGTLWVCHQTENTKAVELVLSSGGRLRRKGIECPR